MFDKTILFPQLYSYNNTIVEEKRAPTDESVKLLREMEQAAEKEVIKTITVGSSTFECKILKSINFIDDSMNYRIIYSLNNKKQIVDVKWGWSEKFELGDQEKMNYIRDELAKDIANNLLNSAFSKLSKFELEGF